jgi:hypothetical protein
MKIKLALAAFTLVITSSLFAQKADIKFNEMTYDFGTVSEEDGKVEHKFEFVNNGTADLLLSNVQASCGCTTPQWSREPIAPKQKGTITVTYAAAGRPGPFTKTITVMSNADKQVLIIKGYVTPRGQKVEDVYPILVGDVRLKSESVNFGDIAQGESVESKLPVVNVSNKDVTITLKKLPSHVTAAPLTLKAGEKGNITLKFDAAKTKSWGNVTSEAVLTTNSKDKKASTQKIILVGNVFEKFTEAQRANAPTAELVREVNVGEIAVGSTKTIKVSVKNTGKSPLFIRSASSSFSDIEVSAPKGGIAPGKSAEVKIEINAKKLAASVYNKFITLQFNDPSNVKRTVSLIFTVANKTK